MADCRFITRTEIISRRTSYDSQEQSLIFIAPGQSAGFEEEEDAMIQPNGWVLAFHPDLIRGTALGRTIQDYHFFSYDIKESLHISGREKELLLESFGKVKYELEHPMDKHSRKLIANNIDLLLNYCERFYDRQFICREYINKDLITRFEALIDNSSKLDDLKFRPLFSVMHTPFSQTYFHGRRADLKIGDLIGTGVRSNYGQRKNARYIYLAATLDPAV